MPEIEYGKQIWKTDSVAARTEARRRAILTRDAETPDQRESIWLNDLAALQVLPDELAEIDGLKRIFAGSGETPDKQWHHSFGALDNIQVVAQLPALQSLSFDGTQVSDLSALSGLSALQSLRFDRTQVSDLSALSGLPALQSLSFDSTRVSDLSALSGLSGLQSLRFSRTQVSDLSALSGLSGLQSLRFSHTQVSDLSAILSLPRFAALEGKYLSFSGTPVARQDRRWEMLEGLPPERAARDVVLYLRGEHPDLQPPEGGGAVATGPAGMAAQSPVRLVQENGVAELEDATQFRPPAPTNPAMHQASLQGLHAMATNLTVELTEAGNVDPRLLRRVTLYSETVDPVRAPVFAVLESAMILLRPLVCDDYTRAALDPGLAAGLDALVAQHDALGATPAIPEVLPDIPHTPETPQDAGIVTQAVDQLAGLIGIAKEQGFVGNTLVVAINSTVAVTNTANSAVPPAAQEDAKHRKGLWSWALRMAGGLTQALDHYGKVHDWALSPAGAALLQQIAILMEKLVGFFT